MKLSRAVVIRSGLRHLITSNFSKGIFSSFFQSRGSFSVSGVSSLYQSLNLPGASFSKWFENCSNGSISMSFWTEAQARSGNQDLRTRGVAGSYLVGQKSRKFIMMGLYSTLSRIPFYIMRKVRDDKKIYL